MDIFSIVLIVVGLVLFETVSSIDNAVINAETLATMDEKARKRFLVWGGLFAVFGVRGLLPWLIVWLAVPSLGAWGAFTAIFSNDPQVAQALNSSAPVLFVSGGTFLLFLFLRWMFVERDKAAALRIEAYLFRQPGWYYSGVAVALFVLVWLITERASVLAISALIGLIGFFVVFGIRRQAEKLKERVRGSRMSELSKTLYLEVIDLNFSIDGILGAFAFTLAVPLILIGSGIGAILVRVMSLSQIKHIRRYAYLRNGAMYSIFFLGLVMILHGLGAYVPSWLSPAFTILIVAFFFWESKRTISA